MAETDFESWNYVTNIASPINPRASAHVSWLTDGNGILMLDDLLPQMFNASAKVTIDISNGWKIISSENRIGPKTFEVLDIEKAVFVIGTDVREKRFKIGEARLTVTTSGQWLFSDDESAKIVKEIYEEYSKIFGANPDENLQISLMPFPQSGIPVGTWEAETRGNSVVIVSADMPFKTQSMQRLREQLRHEIFHLWLPNGVNLSGNYDWFYEGFALYQSLKTGVSLNQIRFEDFLDTLSRAINIDASQTHRLSLIEASKNRWSGDDTQIYARGMLVAFLCDLSILRESNGKRSVADIFRTLYASHKPPNSVTDANTAIITAFESYPSLTEVVQRYVRGSQKIDFTSELEAVGITNESVSAQVNLRLKAKLNGNQRMLLDKLGYNNWRKLTRKP